jgi:hypothetical protein
MSGGRFDHKQYDMNYIADKIEREVLINGKKKEIIEKFKEAVIILRKAAIYTQRIDWLLSGDDEEETFLKRLKKDLEEL